MIELGLSKRQKIGLVAVWGIGATVLAGLGARARAGPSSVYAITLSSSLAGVPVYTGEAVDLLVTVTGTQGGSIVGLMLNLSVNDHLAGTVGPTDSSGKLAFTYTPVQTGALDLYVQEPATGSMSNILSWTVQTPPATASGYWESGSVQIGWTYTHVSGYASSYGDYTVHIQVKTAADHSASTIMIYVTPAQFAALP